MAILAIVLGCQSTNGISVVHATPSHLLTPEAFLGEGRSLSKLPNFDPLEVSERMRTFVRGDIDKINSERARVNALIGKLTDYGYYSNYYEDGLTLSAIDAFERKQGNCLSYTHMFIALARLADLDARYEIVNAPPSYSASQGILEHQAHIRARVVLPHRLYRTRYVTVDFNRRNIRQFEGRVVSDRFGKSLHFANNAVAHWQADDDISAFNNIVRALTLAPRNPDHWVNLAAFYRRAGKQSEAEAIYRYTLSLDPSHLVALGGIVFNAKAEDYTRAKAMLERRRNNNAYYQFALAQRAYALKHYGDALQFVNRSLTLQKRNHEFFRLKGDILLSMDNHEDARKNYIQAINHASTPRERRKYERVLTTVVEEASDSPNFEPEPKVLGIKSG